MSKTKKLLTLASLSWMLLTGFTPYSEGKRLYIGPDRHVDWVDVGCLYQRLRQGWTECWCDTSAIQRITPSSSLAMQHYRAYTIKKVYSTWNLTYFSPLPTDVGLALVEPLEVVKRCTEVPDVP